MSATMPPLRPMNAGDIFDAAIRLYRKNFVILVGIIAVISVPLLIPQLIAALLAVSSDRFLSRGLFVNPGATSAPSDPTALFIYYGGAALTSLLAALARAFQAGALAVVVSERYLGHAVTIRGAYREALRHWASLLAAAIIVGIVLISFFAIFFVPFFGLALAGPAFGGSPAFGAAFFLTTLCVCAAFIPALLLFLFLNTHWVFASQAIVLENLGGIAGLRRSWRLAHGQFWRVLGITLLLGIMIFVLSVGPSYLIGIVSAIAPSFVLATTIQTVLTTIIQILIVPIQLAALTLLYYDLRIRQEGFDLEMLTQSAPPSLPDLSGAPA